MGIRYLTGNSRPLEHLRTQWFPQQPLSRMSELTGSLRLQALHKHHHWHRFDHRHCTTRSSNRDHRFSQCVRHAPNTTALVPSVLIIFVGSIPVQIARSVGIACHDLTVTSRIWTSSRCNSQWGKPGKNYSSHRAVTLSLPSITTDWHQWNS
jgi:hypothetical protein